MLNHLFHLNLKKKITQGILSHVYIHEREKEREDVTLYLI